MKHFKIIALLLFISPAFITFTGCSDDSTPPVVEDTTDNTIKILNSFDIGNDRYEIQTNTDLTDAIYTKTLDQTTVTITGVSIKKSGTNVKDGAVTVQLKFPGKTKAEFEMARMHDITLEISIKEENRPEIAYGTSFDSELVFDVFEYGEVGEVVKGTFSGKLKSGSSIQVKNGLFEVIRAKDI
jgi:hypothetical protein